MTSLYYEANRNGEETVLLIHGWAGSNEVWRYLKPILSSNWKVITVDLWGHGQSKMPKKKITPKSLSSELLKVICELGCTDCYVIGHSMGCLVAEHFALYYPNYVKGIILIEGIYPIEKMFTAKNQSLDKNSRLQIFQQMLAPFSTENWAVEIINKMLQTPKDTLLQYSEYLNINRTEILKKLKCPYFIISREKYKTEFLNPKLWLTHEIPINIICNIKNTETHFVLEENPKEANSTISKCLTKLKNKVDNQIKLKVKEFFTRQAQNYYESHMHASEGLNEVRELLSLSPKDNVIDIGCGAGHTSFEIAPKVNNVMAYDFADDMLKIVEKESKVRGFTNIQTIKGDAENIIFPDSTFDKAVCRIAAHHFPNLKAFMNEVSRVLKRNGIFVLVDNSAPTDRDLYFFSDYVEKLKDSSHFHLYTESSWRESIIESGLNINYLRYYKSKHIFKEWSDVASIENFQIDFIKNYFLKANQRIQKYFNILIENNEVVHFTIDRIVICCTKNS